MNLKNKTLLVTLVLLQGITLFAAEGTRQRQGRGMGYGRTRTMKGRHAKTNKADGQSMRGKRGAQHILAPYEGPIKSGNVAAFTNELNNYRGGQVGLYALVGKVSIALVENEADENLTPAEKGHRTRQLHEMRDAVVAKLQGHVAERHGPQRKAQRQARKQERRTQKAARRTAKTAGTSTIAAPISVEELD